MMRNVINHFWIIKGCITGTFLLIFTISIYGQELYVRTFGNKDATPLIFLHGGPGYNSASFEVTTAPTLAKRGYYVVVYDRRGEGRSVDPNAKYTFRESHTDLLKIMDSLNVEKANLIGHSFGGMIAVTFNENYRDHVESILLVSAPVSLQASFKTIIDTCEKIYVGKGDESMLASLRKLKEMDTTSLYYSSYCFMHAMQNKFYSPQTPTEKAKELYELFKTDSTLIQYSSKMGYLSPQGFWQNEAYTTLDLTSNIKDLIKNDTAVFGIYGREDGLYSREQVAELKMILGENHLMYLENCSHSVFIDRQQEFMSALDQWLK